MSGEHPKLIEIAIALVIFTIAFTILYAVWMEDKLNVEPPSTIPKPPATSAPAPPPFSATLRSDADAARIKALEAEVSALRAEYTQFRAYVAVELGLPCGAGDEQILDAAMKLKAQHDDFVGRLGSALHPAAAPDAYQDGAEAGILKTVERLVSERKQ